MRVLIIGYGSMGRRHAVNAAALGHDVRVSDRDVARQEAAVGDGFAHAPAWWVPDAVVIATPVATHQALQKSARAPHVLIEKPLALSEADFLQGYAAGDFVNIKGGRTWVGHNWRFHPAVATLRDALAGETMLSALFCCLADMRAWPGQGYGDALLECGSHEVDTALHLLGPAVLRSAVREVRVDGWTLVLRHDSGCETTVAVRGDVSAPQRTCRLWTSRETVCGYDLPPSDRLSQEAVERSYLDEMAAFLAAATVQPVDARLAGLADGMAVLRILDEARRVAA